MRVLFMICLLSQFSFAQSSYYEVNLSEVGSSKKEAIRFADKAISGLEDGYKVKNCEKGEVEKISWRAIPYYISFTCLVKEGYEIVDIADEEAMGHSEYIVSRR